MPWRHFDLIAFSCLSKAMFNMTKVSLGSFHFVYKENLSLSSVVDYERVFIHSKLYFEYAIYFDKLQFEVTYVSESIHKEMHTNKQKEPRIKFNFITSYIISIQYIFLGFRIPRYNCKCYESYLAQFRKECLGWHFVELVQN